MFGIVFAMLNTSAWMRLPRAAARSAERTNPEAREKSVPVAITALLRSTDCWSLMGGHLALRAVRRRVAVGDVGRAGGPHPADEAHGDGTEEQRPAHGEEEPDDPADLRGPDG